MTIVKPSSKPPRRSSIDFSLKKAKTLANNVCNADVFSNSHLPGLSNYNNESFSSNESGSISNDNVEHSGEDEPAPK